MASKPRNYEAMRPVLITLRCVLRLDLLALAGIPELLAKVLARNADRCGVDVLAWTIQSNHAHFIVRQSIDHHCPGRKTGIAAFMRNVGSVLARYGNSRATLQGRFLERTYRSHSIRTIGDLVRYLAYVHGQSAHHRLRTGTADVDLSSAAVLCRGLPDGIVDLIPDAPLFDGAPLEQRCESLRALVEQIVLDACQAERRVEALDTPGTTLTPRQLRSMRRDAWREATERAMSQWGPRVIEADSRTLQFRTLAEWIGAEAARNARLSVLNHVWVPSEPHDRRPPRLGLPIEIRVRYETPPPRRTA